MGLGKHANFLVLSSFELYKRGKPLEQACAQGTFGVPKVPHRNPGREVGYPTESRGYTTAGVLSNLGVPCAWARGSGARGTFAALGEN